MVATGSALLATLLPAAIYLTINYVKNNTTTSHGGSNSGDGGKFVVKVERITFKNNRTLQANIKREYDIHAIQKVFSSGDRISERKEFENEIKSSSVVKKSVVSEKSVVIPELPVCCHLRPKGVADDSISGQTLSHCENILRDGITEIGVWSVPHEFLLRKDDVTVFKLRKLRPSCRSKSTGHLRSMATEIMSPSRDVFFPNGWLKWNNENYRPSEYCVNGFTSKNELEILLCKPNCQDPNTPCVQKCCELDEIYSLGMNGKRGGCLPLDLSNNETFWTPTFYERINLRVNAKSASEIVPHIIHKAPTDFKSYCQKKLTTVFPYSQNVVNFLNKMLRRGLQSLQFQMREDGWLMHPNLTDSHIAIMKESKTTKYCIDGVSNYGESEKFSNKEQQTVLFTCAIPDVEYGQSEIPQYERNPIAIKPVKNDDLKTTPQPSPTVIPSLPTCCPLDPEGTTGKSSHYCTRNQISDSSTTQELPVWEAASKFMSNNQSQKFRLSPNILRCKDNWTKIFILNYDNLPGGGSPSLMNNGMLKFYNEFYSGGQFCVNGIFSRVLEILMCQKNCSDSKTLCIKKCCDPTEVYSIGDSGMRRGCVPLGPNEVPWSPSLYSDMDNRLTSKEIEKVNPYVVQSFPPKFQYNCYKNTTLVFPFKKKHLMPMQPLAKINLQFRTRQDGKIIYRHPSIKDGATGNQMESSFDGVEYCVDSVKSRETLYNRSDDDSVLFICSTNPSQ